MKSPGLILGRIFVLLLAVLLGGAIVRKLGEDGPAPPSRRGEDLPIPVEAAPVARGPIELRRILSGTLEASQQIVVVPRVGGRLVRIAVDLADPIEHGQVVAELDGEEFRQELAQAEANLAVARANFAEAESAAEIARRALARSQELRARGVASEAELDAAQADLLAAAASVEVSRAAITRVESAVETARIRLGYTRVTASWSSGDGPRRVSRRFVDVGDTVSANAPLLSVVDLDPLTAVLSITEKDYALLRPGQEAVLTTEAYPGERFGSRVRRVAPVFSASSRQARVELEVPNPDQRLRPGMFILAEVRLDRAEDAFVVPYDALTTHAERTGVFVVGPGGDTVAFRAAAIGIREGDRVQLRGIEFGSPLPRVVTLGHELLSDGARIVIPDDDEGIAPTPTGSGGTGGTPER